jgi:uncharacterized protein
MALAESRLNPEMKTVAAGYLQALGEGDSGVTLAVLTSDDGFEVASYHARGLSGRIAAMSSSLQALGTAMAREVGLGQPRCLIIESRGGTILVLGLATASPRLSLTVVGSSDVTLGQLLWAARNCRRQLEQALPR